MAFVTTTSPDLYSTTSNLEEIPAGADPLQYADDEKMNQILVGLTALHGWASGVPVSETANGHFLALAAGSSAAVSIAGGVRIRQSSGALDYSYNTGAYARLLSKLTLASQATGDIMYASAADTWSRLAAGTNGYVLTMSGGLPVWAAGGGGGGLSSPVGAADGGTGITSYAVGDIIYASAATTLSKLAAVGVGQVLASAGVTTAPAYTATPTLTTLGLAAGSTAACSLYATGDANTGIYFPAADQIAIVSGGTARVVIDGSTELHSLIQTGPAGSASLPTYGFTGDPNTGAYSVGADQYGITVGGTLRLTIDTGTVTSTLPVMVPTGSAAAPSLTFNGDANTGLFANGADTIGLATGGSLRMDLSTTAITMRLATMLAVGTVSAPGLAFDGDDDLGLYRVAANTLGISTGNFLKMELGDATKNIALRATSATTNAVQTLSTLEALCSGTAAIGFGAEEVVNGQNASGSQVTMGTQAWSWLNATAASEAALLTTKIRKAGSTASVAKLSETYARYALNGGSFADSSAFEVVTGGAGADGRGRFQNTASATGVGGVIAANDSGGALTALLDGTSTTRSGVAGGSFFVGISSGAHFGALTNTDSHWITGTADSTADRVASAVYNSGNRYLRIGYFVEYTEMSAPAAGAANTARVFAVDSGGGKTVLKVQFATGAAQTIATEP